MRSYLKEQVDKIMAYLFKVERRTLLWTNPNPNTGFGAQTISLDLSEYDAVEIEAYYVSTDANNRTLYSNRLPFGTVAVLAPQGQGRAISARKATINNAGITFTTGWLFYSTTEQLSVNAAVPVRIYGIKSGGGVLRNPVVSRLSAILKIGGGVDERRPQGTDRPAMLQNQSCGQQDQHSRQRCYKWLVLEEVVGWYIRSVVEHKRDSDKFQYIPRLHASNSYTNFELTSSWVWQRIRCLLLPRLEQRREYIWKRKHKRQLRCKPLRSLQGVTISERRWAA